MADVDAGSESLVYDVRGETLQADLLYTLVQRLSLTNDASDKETNALHEQTSLVIVDRKDSLWESQGQTYCFHSHCLVPSHQVKVADAIEKPVLASKDWKSGLVKMPNLRQLFVDVENADQILGDVIQVLRSSSVWQMVIVKQLCITTAVWKEMRGCFRDLEYMHCRNMESTVAAELIRSSPKLKVLRVDGSQFCDHGSLPDGLLYVTCMTSDLKFTRKDLCNGYMKKLESLSSLTLSAPPVGSSTPPFGQTFQEHVNYVSMLGKNHWFKGLKKFCPSRITGEDLLNIVQLCPNLQQLSLMNARLDDHALNLTLQLRQLHTLRVSLQTGKHESDDGTSNGTGITFDGFMLFLKYAFHKDRQIRNVHIFSELQVNAQQLLDMQSWSDQADLDSIELVIHADPERLVPLSIQNMTNNHLPDVAAVSGGSLTETRVDGIIVCSMHDRVGSRAHSPAIMKRKASIHRRICSLLMSTLSLCPTARNRTSD